MGQEPLLLGIEEDSYALQFGEQGPFNSSVLRVTYSSLITPDSTLDINMVTGKHLLKLDEHWSYLEAKSGQPSSVRCKATSLTASFCSAPVDSSTAC